MHRYISIVIALALLFTCFAPTSMATAYASDLSFSFTALDGRTVSSATVKGERTLLIFFRTTCLNSRETIRQLAAVPWSQRSDLNIIAVDLDGRSAGDVRAFADTYAANSTAITFCTGGNTAGRTMSSLLATFGVSSAGIILPVSFLIGPDGYLCDYMTEFTSPRVFLSLLDRYTNFSNGDVNDDGFVDSTDARLVLQYAVNKIPSSALQYENADVNDDFMVDSTDARLILQYTVGKITQFPTRPL